MRDSAATLGRRGREAVDVFRHRLRDSAFPPLLALVLAGAGGYVGAGQPGDVAADSSVALSSARMPASPEPASPSVVLAAPERALDAVRIVVAGAATSAAAAVLYDAYVAAVETAPPGCHLSASVLAALGQAEPGPLGDTESPRDLATAVAAAVDSLCAHGRDLARPADLRAALLARTGSPVIVRLVQTLKARYDLIGLGLVGAPGPVLVPLLLEQATALVADPYGPAEVHPSRASSEDDGGRLPRPAAAVAGTAGPSESAVTRDGQVPLPSAPGAAAVSVPAGSSPVAPAGQSAEGEAPSASPESASPTAVNESTDSSEASGAPEQSAPVEDPATDSVEPAACTTDLAVAAPDTGATSDAAPTEVVDPTDPGASTGDAAGCPSEPAQDAGSVTPQPDPSADTSTTAGPDPAQETQPALP